MKKLVTLFLIISCAKQQNPIELIEKKQFQVMISKDVQLIDVRTQEEFNEGYIGNAKNIDFKTLDFKQKISKLDKNKPVLIYCYGGGRSAKASKIFQSLGFKKIYDLKGGYSKW